MKKIINKIFTEINFYARHQAGVIAVAFGFMVPIIVGGVGLSVDMAQAYLVKSRLSASLDAAALAAAASGKSDENELQEIVDAYMEANYPEGRIGRKIDTNIEINGSEITVTASAALDTAFMRIFGYDDVTVEASTTVQREVRGLEVVMVLDNTGSMATNNNIQTLRDATQSFIEILFESIEDPEYVKVGLVPYASSVNVGPYGLGTDLDDDYYDDAFVIPPEDDVYASYYYGYNPYTRYYYGIDEDDLEYNPSAKGQWHGCVLAEDYPLDTEDHEGPWVMYRHDYNGNDYYENQNSYDGTYGDLYNAYYGPNVYCPQQPIVPMNSDEEYLLAAASNMQANGATLSNFGMVWGWRVISPEYPFTEGAAYDDEDWDKVVLIMTDGINSMSNVYSAYGKSNTHNIDNDDLDDRLLETCSNMKEEKILIYAVTFDDSGNNSGVDEDTVALFKACATTPANYREAESQEALQEVFEQIAREVSNLYIKQ